MRVVAIIQARMSSSRFPGKMLKTIGNVPLIAFVVFRVRASTEVDDVLVATSDNAEDDALAEAALAAGANVFRGSLADVLGRITSAARLARADAVVRITGDCPLTDADVLDSMIRRFRRGDLEYLSNVSPPSYPNGLDAEIISINALEAADLEATELHQREHVTPFVRERPDRFRSENMRLGGADLSHLHWSVDHPADLDLVNDLLSAAGSTLAKLPDLLNTLRSRPDLESRSRSNTSHEGALKTFLVAMEERAPRPVTTTSEALWLRAREVIPAGIQTPCEGPSQYIEGFAPRYLARGSGSHVWDADGNKYIDYSMGLGAVTLGHAHPEVTAAVTHQIEEGNCFTLMHPLEVELAERVCSLIPCAEMVRFTKSGSDAIAACIRVAQAHTGRKAIARHGYHDWQSSFVDATGDSGAHDNTRESSSLSSFPFNDLAALEQVLVSRPHAAILMEPVSIVSPAPGYLEGVRALADKHEVVLIFDEVLTGFRYASGGAQEYFGVTPDLCAFGEGVANGHPLSLVVGKREFMRPLEKIFFNNIFGGETGALAAAMTTLDVMLREDYWSHVWRLGARLQAGYRAMTGEFGLGDFTQCQGLPPWTIITFSNYERWTGAQLRTLFQQEMIRRGILFSGSQFVSLAHSDADIEETLDAYRESMRVLKFALEIHSVTALTHGQ